MSKNYKNTARLCKAMQKKNIDLAEITYLLDNGADANAMVSPKWVNISKRPLIFIAIERDYLKLVKLFLTKGSDVNKVDSDKNTILCFAYGMANKNHGPKYQHKIEILKELLNRPELDLNAKHSGGTTFTEMMIISREKDIVELLINDSRIDLTAKNKYGHNLLDMNNVIIDRRESNNKDISDSLAIKKLLENKGLKTSEKSFNSKFSAFDSSSLIDQIIRSKLDEKGDGNEESEKSTNKESSFSIHKLVEMMVKNLENKRSEEEQNENKQNEEEQNTNFKTHSLFEENKTHLVGESSSNSGSDTEEG